MDGETLKKKNNRTIGREFENEVIKSLEGMGIVISRWNCNIYDGQITQAKYHPFNRFNGFPDFIIIDKDQNTLLLECKSNGTINKEEKDKIEVYKKFGFKILLAQKNLEGNVEIGHI